MNDIFYRMPRLTILAIGFVMVVGLGALTGLPRQEDPTMAERFGNVETFLGGASAARIESLVTEPVENALREVPEVKTISSLSRTGYSLVNVELYDSVGRAEVDLVWSEVRDKLAERRPDLPLEASAPQLEARGPVATTIAVAIISESTPIALLERIAVELRSRLAALPGTKETDILGEPQAEIQVAADPHKLARMNLGVRDLTSRIADSDTKRAAGEFNSTGSALVVEVKGELSSVERINSIPLARTRNGQFIRVADVADVHKAYVEPPETLAIVNGKRAIVVTTTMETGQRVDRWSEYAKDIIARYRSELPAGITLDIIVDQNDYTNARLESLFQNLMLAIALVLVSLVFLMGVRSAIIVGSALPLTIAMVLAGLQLLDIPLHQMSVTGLIIALGLLIDNAIVVVEEYKHQRARGRDFAAAVGNSVRHLFVPLLASTATTAFAFMPIATSPGGVGDFTGTMAVSVILSVSSSFVLAMTVIPAIAGFIDRRFPVAHGEDHRWWVNGWSPASLAHQYRQTLKLTVERPWLGIALSLVLPLAGFALVTTLTMTFFPPVDRNQFQVQISLPANTSIRQTQERVARARSIVDATPEVISSQWFIGEGSPRVYYNMMINADGVASFANAFVTTRDVDDPRKILPDLQRKLMREMPDARILTLPFEQGPPFAAPIEVRLVGPDLKTLKSIGDQVRLVLSEVSDVTYTTSTLSNTVPQLSVYPNENMARSLGLSNRDLPTQLNGQLSGFIAGTVMEGSTEVPIRVRYEGGLRSDLDNLATAPVIGARASGNRYAGIPLEQTAEIMLEPSPNQIDRYQGERINTVSGYTLPYTIPSVAVAEFRKRLGERNLNLPPGYRLEFGGEEEERGEAVGNIVSTFVMYLWLMVAVIVVSLNSFRHAGIIGIVGVLSIGLAFFGVWLSGYPMGYMAFIGTLGLIGLAINGAIIVLSALKANAQANAADTAVMVNVVNEATRHILSTTVTTIGGFLPLILFGGHFWPPLAMAIAGGVAGSAILALYLVPALFSLYAHRDLQRSLRSAATALPATP